MLNIFVSRLDILVSKVFCVKPTFCEHFLIVQCHGERNRKHNARLVWFGFAVLSTFNPSGLLDVVSIANFVPARSSKPVFLFALSFQRLKALSAIFVGFFSPVCQPFFKQAGELGVKLRDVVHEIDWSVLFLPMFQIWYLRK